MLSDSLKQEIQAAYSRWIAFHGYKPRYAQKQMIAMIANTIGSIAIDEEGDRQKDYTSHIAMIEAGTGTGKTIAYSIASIFLAKALNKSLVISTATIALQEQLVFKDLPDLQKNAGVDFSFFLAKGRGRYLCVSKLNKYSHDIQRSESEAALFPDEEVQLVESTIAVFKDMDAAYEQKTWDGDRDNWSDYVRAEDWQHIAADRASCSGKKCAHYSSCALFKSRDLLRNSEVIVANHDLVLADLANDGGNVLPAAHETIYLFDEAHHLPAKSQSHLSQKVSLIAEKKHIEQWKKLEPRIDKVFASKSNELLSIKKSLRQLNDTIDELINGLYMMAQDVFEVRAGAADQAFTAVSRDAEVRFKHGEVPQYFKDHFAELSRCLQLKTYQLEKLSKFILDTYEQSQNALQLAKESMFTLVGTLYEHCRQAQSVYSDYALASETGRHVAPIARWCKKSDDRDDYIFYSAPIEMASTLTKIIWDKCFSAVMTSATLTALGRFDYIANQIGHIADDKQIKLLAQLNFPEATFCVPKMQSDPTQFEPHSAEIASLLRQVICESVPVGSLVLFTSRKQMEWVYDLLGDEMQELCLMQGDAAKSVMIERHKEAIDQGKMSMLLGLSSLSEGLDLPGKYCELVVIAKLPFAVPDSPIDDARGEWVERCGGNPFWDVSVPEASIKLLQACGRLLRGENDRGRVILMDKRILQKAYGKSLLASLPPFKTALNVNL